MNSKYVFFDIDGTIYDYEHGVIPSAREAIRLLREHGHHPVLCTGRTKIMIFDEILDMGFDGIIGGAGTYIEWEGQVLKREDLPTEKAKKAIEILRANGFCSYPEGHEIFYYDPQYVENGPAEVYRVYQKKIPGYVKPIDFSKDMRVAKVSASYTPLSNRDKVVEALGDDFYWVDHSGTLFETIPEGASKGRGIKILMDHIGADMEDTFAFGDSYNDLDMLQSVKYGILMGNSKESLKKLVPLHTEPMLEDGVFKALKRYALI